MKITNQLFQNKKYWSIIALVAIIGLSIFLRLNTIKEPLTLDMCVYAYVGHQMLEGEKLYSDLVDNKPPGIYFLYMFAEMIGGYNQYTYYWLGIIFTILSLLLIFIILYRNTSVLFAIAGSLMWSIISSSYSIGAHQPNTEIFINTFLLFSLWAFSEFLGGKKAYLWLAGIGFGIAAVFKTNVLFVVLAVSMYFPWMLIKNKNYSEFKKNNL
ncbi:glycosyltransferase family 39 protein [bacterium]|nr:glycosyltransferase family 39 protein [bacterium]